MAESMSQKLQRLAAERKAAELNKAATQPVVQEKTNGDDSSTISNNDGVATETTTASSTDSGNVLTASSDNSIVSGSTDSSNEDSNTGAETSSGVSTTASEALPEANSADVPSTDVLASSSNSHPLAMELASLRAALDADDPNFKTALRDIHRHLSNDPEVVTIMTEDQIGLVVAALCRNAQIEIIAPAQVKALKAATKAASKKVISADDL